MADTTNATSAVHWPEIDAVRYWDAVLIETATDKRHRFKMANTVRNFGVDSQLLGLPESFGGRVCAGLEPTADHHRALANQLPLAGCVTRADDVVVGFALERAER